MRPHHQRHHRRVRRQKRRRRNAANGQHGAAANLALDPVTVSGIDRFCFISGENERQIARHSTGLAEPGRTGHRRRRSGRPPLELRQQRDVDSAHPAGPLWLNFGFRNGFDC